MSENITKYESKDISLYEKKYDEIKVRTITDVFNSENKSLNLTKTEIGEKGVKALIVYAITDLIGFFNIGKVMSIEQVAQTTELIIEEYGMFKIDDFKLCFNRAKKGEYGQVYDRLDGQVIFMWLEKYANERFKTADDISYYEHLENKQSFLNTSERLKEEAYKHELEVFKIKIS